MMLKNLTNNAKNLAANAKIEDMTQLFKSTVGKQDVKHALSGVMDISKEVKFSIYTSIDRYRDVFQRKYFSSTSKVIRRF